MVVHFDRLKHTRFDDPTPPSPSAADTPQTLGQDMELLYSDSDEPPPGPPPSLPATAPGTRAYPSAYSHTQTVWEFGLSIKT